MVTLGVIAMFALLGVWLVLGFFCTCRILKAMAGDNTQTLILILILTHFVGFGFIMAGGLAWAAWIMVSFPFRLFSLPTPPVSEIPHMHVCADCRTRMQPVTCMSCGPNRVPDHIPLAWAD